MDHTNEESEFLQHEPCPKCGSRDNLARYSDGHAYCFGCEHRENTGGEQTVVIKKGEKNMDFVEGEIANLNARGITEET
jgi:twinkle protein